ncbi:ABC transporter permease [Variovorax sp. PBL-E5]|uniref:ABC transporter permease n=1 Tax=Variovorax sp. PBL-E5 TaxID=434014 RepID=UPI001318A786|nr:ABC transporter permease [Variovorax sp. PBL-E5]VTU38256.1 Putative aliphatic sulfonates transport permease protein SsuC [Variovorax sp. PBL-E5]
MSPMVILAAWELATRIGLVRSVLLPAPSDVARTFIDVLFHGYAGVSIFWHIGASVARVLAGFIAAAVFGIAIGLARGRYSLVDAVLLVPAEVVRPIPPLGLIPLFILWFGIGEVSKVLLIFYYVLLIVMLNTESGVRSCPPDLIRAAQSQGATPVQIFRYVIFPAALPQIMTGLRVGMGSALAILVASELLGGDRGLGFVVLDASNFFRTNEVFVGIVLIGLLGLISDRALNWLSRRVVHWERKK